MEKGMTLNDLIKILDFGNGDILFVENRARYAGTVHDRDFRRLIKSRFGKRTVWFIEAQYAKPEPGCYKPYIYLELNEEDENSDDLKEGE